MSHLIRFSPHAPASSFGDQGDCCVRASSAVVAKKVCQSTNEVASYCLTAKSKWAKTERNEHETGFGLCY